MWDNEAPLKLLQSMSSRLDNEHLRQIQQIIDVDKYKNSYFLGRDLCGEYAPFCEVCDKCGNYPCAVAYIKMKQSEGMAVEIAPVDAVEEEPVEEPVEEVATEEPEEVVEEVEEIVATEPEAYEEVVAEEPEEAVEEVKEEQPVEEVVEEVEEEQPVEEVYEQVDEDYSYEEEVPKKRIRIAIARRKR